MILNFFSLCGPKIMMKSALFFTTALLVGAAQADVLGLTAEVASYYPSADNSFISDYDLDSEHGTYVGIAFEPPLALIPNVRFQNQNLELQANDTPGRPSAKIDLSHQDYTLYYEFLDGLLWINLDAGVTFRHFDVSLQSNDSYTLGYLSGYMTVPGTRLSLGAEVKTGGSVYLNTVNTELFDRSRNVTDTTFKVKYQTPFFVGLEGGYRKMKLHLSKDIKSASSAIFIGAFVGF